MHIYRVFVIVKAAGATAKGVAQVRPLPRGMHHFILKEGGVHIDVSIDAVDAHLAQTSCQPVEGRVGVGKSVGAEEGVARTHHNQVAIEGPTLNLARIIEVVLEGEFGPQPAVGSGGGEQLVDGGRHHKEVLIARIDSAVLGDIMHTNCKRGMFHGRSAGDVAHHKVHAVGILRHRGKASKDNGNS